MQCPGRLNPAACSIHGESCAVPIHISSSSPGNKHPVKAHPSRAACGWCHGGVLGSSGAGGQCPSAGPYSSTSSWRRQRHHSKDLNALPTPCCKGPWPSCLGQGTNLHPTLCDNPRTRLPHGILCYSTATAAPPCRRGVTLCVCGHHWGKPVHNDEEHNLGFTREQKGNTMPARALRDFPSKFPINFPLAVGFAPQEAGGDG